MLKEINLRTDIFDMVLSSHPIQTVYTPNVKLHWAMGYQGKKDKKIIMYDEEYMVCKLITLYTTLKELGESDKIELDTDSCWKQVLIRRDKAINASTIESSVTGSYATNYINKVLKRYYTEDEIEACLDAHQIEEDDKIAQLHHNPAKLCNNKVICYKNCYEFDINAAHTAALLEIFPKAHDAIMDMFEHRHDNNNKFKKMINFYVGCLGKRPKEGKNYNTDEINKMSRHRKTYNWIVDKTSKQLLDLEEYCGGFIIYDNTDGVIIQNPDNIHPYSNEIGEFGLEYQGDVYVYTDDNYLLIKASELKGNALNSVRDRVDLENGVIVHYKRIRNEWGDYVAQDVVQEQLEIKEIY